jgi:hypothetical protein
LLPQVCLAVNANIVIFRSIRVFVQALVRNLFYSCRVERYSMCFKAEACDRILCDAWKKW